MKQVIENKLYDTEKATFIGEAHGPHNPGDFHYWEEGLYVTKSGRYFLAGEGGAMSKYGKAVPGAMGGGEEITPITKEEALTWAEKHLDPETVQDHFGDMIEEA